MEKKVVVSAVADMKSGTSRRVGWRLALRKTFLRSCSANVNAPRHIKLRKAEHKTPYPIDQEKKKNP